MTNLEKFQLIGVLSVLPPDKLDEVADFAMFLRDRYGIANDADIGDEWSEDDYTDATRFAMDYGYAGLEDEE